MTSFPVYNGMKCVPCAMAKIAHFSFPQQFTILNSEFRSNTKDALPLFSHVMIKSVFGRLRPGNTQIASSLGSPPTLGSTPCSKE